MYTYHSFIQHLEQRIRALEDRALLAEREVQTLKESIAQLKPVNIGSIQYKVQELSVSELSGTLNVGLTSLADPEQVEAWLGKDSGNEVSKPVHLEHLQNESGLNPNAG